MLKKVLLGLYLVTIVSCANIITPDGGEKDLKPPIITGTIPQLGKPIPAHTNKFVIKFNEYIKLKDAQKISLNPRTIRIKESRVIGKYLHIQTDTIPENTTISIQLDRSVCDITEENILNKTTLIFYTGTYPDSNKIRLHAKYNNQYQGSFKALLYRDELPDTNPQDIAPEYIFYSTNDTIHAQGLPKENFHVILLQDENNNDRIDAEEQTGFFRDAITADTNTNEIKSAILFRDNTFIRPQLSEYYSKQYGTFIFITRPKGLRIRLIDNNLFTEEAHSVLFPGMETDTIVWFSPMADMTEGHFDLYLNDTYFRDLTTNHMNNTFMMRKLVLRDEGINETLFDLGDTIRIMMNNPIYKFNKDKSIIYIDSFTQAKEEIFYFTDQEKTRFRIKTNWRPKSNYIIKFLPGAFEDIFYQKNDTFQLVFRTKTEEEYGSQTFKFSDCFTDNLRCIIRDDKKQQIRSFKIREKEETNIPYLKPGRYDLMIFEDKNLNTTLDEGYYRKKELPEPYYILNRFFEIVPKLTQETLDISLKGVN